MIHAAIFAFLLETIQPKPRPQLHPPAFAARLSIDRLDQASNRIEVRHLLPGERVTILVNGRLAASGIARGGDIVLRLRKQLAIGTTVTALARPSAQGPQSRATTQVGNDYLQYHYDLGRTGWNANETTLTVANVNKKTFGHLMSLPVDGFVFAQPLFVSGVTVGSNTYNLAIVATENDSVFAFDDATGNLVWSNNFVNTANGETPIPDSAVIATDIAPVIGITSTPVIDPNTNVVYFVCAIQQSTNNGYVYHQYLHAVDLTTGLDEPYSPVDMTATAMLSNNTPLTFDPLVQLNRASLLLSNGVVYVGFGSHNDAPFGSPHGWIFAYDESLNLLSFFNTALQVGPKYHAGIWGAGWGPVADENGLIYFATGDGPFNGNLGEEDWGETVLQMTPQLTINNYFTPYNENTFQQHDIGSGGVLILPDQPGLYPHLATIAGDQGTIFLLNRDSMGQFTPNGPDNVVQEIPTALNVVRGGPAYYAGPTGTYLYYCGWNNPLEAYALSTSPSTALTLAGTSKGSCGGGGGTIPAVSSNGATAGTGIVWITTRPNAQGLKPVLLRALDATNIASQLVQLPVGVWENTTGWPFLTPTVINGQVFVGSSSSVEVFGLLPGRR